jgi:ABC-2 type transport system ATP-binding protein
LTTQYLDEADRLAEQLAVIDAGRVIAEGTPAELKAASGGERLEVRLADLSSLDAASSALAPLSSDGPVRADGLVLSLPLRTRAGAVAEAVRVLDSAGVTVEDLAVVTPTLDDVFLQLTGHVAEEREERE